MWRAFWIIEFIALAIASCASAGSLYLTTSGPLEGVGYTANDSYSFIAPYFASVETKVSVSIVKSTTPSNSMSNQGSKESAPATPGSPPTISRAQASAENNTTTLTVSCDLSSVIASNQTIIVSGVEPNSFNGNFVVDSVTPTTVTIKQVISGTITNRNGAIITAACPPAATGTLSVTIGVTPVPVRRWYLYLQKDAFYSDTINLGVGIDGMLSNSDTSSAQQITSILNELAQTAASVIGGGGVLRFGVLATKTQPSFRNGCFNAINDLVRPGPYYAEWFLRRSDWVKDKMKYKRVPDPNYHSTGHSEYWEYPLENVASGLEMKLRIRPLLLSAGHQVQMSSVNPGLVAFFPVPTEAFVFCRATDKYAWSDQPDVGKVLFLSAPATVNLYTDSRLLDPQRDFLTGPQDTLTFSSGFFIGHKYTVQSPAKTIVDTVTAPIRAMMPSVSVTQSTSVSTTGATTTTKSSTITPPKSQ